MTEKQVEKNEHIVKTEEVKPFMHSEECVEYNFNYESGTRGLCICEAEVGNVNWQKKNGRLQVVKMENIEIKHD